MVCVNTHYASIIGNIANDLIELSIPILLYKIRNPIFITLAATSIIIRNIPLVSQFDARDFSLVKKGDYNDPYYDDKLINIDILAVNDGVVESVYNHIKDNAKYILQKSNPGGNDIIIQHNNYKSYYAHLKYNSILVKPGDYVKKGQKIASMGDTGNSTNQHLHFSLNYGNPREFSAPKILDCFDPYKSTPIPWIPPKNVSEIMDKTDDVLIKVANLLQYYYDKPLKVDNSGYLDSFAYIS